MAEEPAGSGHRIRRAMPGDPLAGAGDKLGLSVLAGLTRRGAHPRTTDRVRAFLAKVSLPILIVEFFLVVIVIALLLAVAFELTDQEPDTTTFAEWWKELTLYLLSFPPEKAIAPDVIVGRGLLQVIASVAGLVLPALFVGAIVLKLFISPDLFTMRNKVAAIKNTPGDPRLEPGGYQLAVRGYSSTPFRLLNVNFTAILRFAQRDSDGTLQLLHRPLRVANTTYAVAHPHVPYTLSIPIDDGDWEGERGGPLARIQGFELGDDSVLVVMIEGSIPELSSSFNEAHQYPLASALSYEPYAGLDVDQDRPATEWTGWESFDEA